MSLVSEKAKLDYELAQRTNLSPLISSPADVWTVTWPEAQANYITMKAIVAGVCNLEESDALEGKIVCIRGADPGYDWIFRQEYFWIDNLLGRSKFSYGNSFWGNLGFPRLLVLVS